MERTDGAINVRAFGRIEGQMVSGFGWTDNIKTDDEQTGKETDGRTDGRTHGWMCWLGNKLLEAPHL